MSRTMLFACLAALLLVVAGLPLGRGDGVAESATDATVAVLPSPTPPLLGVVEDGITEVHSLRAGPSKASETVAAVVTEGFEGAWPGPGWTLEDLGDGDGGEYLWGKRDCHPCGQFQRVERGRRRPGEQPGVLIRLP